MQTKLDCHFNLSEFSCPCCGQLPDKYLDNVVSLVWVLEQIRNDLGKPIFVTSGYRCPAHNEDVGGVSNSQHLTASAVDFTVDSVSPSVLAMLAFKYNIRSIGIGDDFVHIDLRNLHAPATDSNIWHY